MLIIKSIYWFASYDVLFGNNSIIFSKQFSNLGFANFVAYHIQLHKSPFAAMFYIASLLLLSLIGLTKFRVHFVFDFIIWLIVINIHNKLYSTLSGGEYILNQFLFFNCFISYNFKKQDSFVSQLKLTVHNFAVMAVLIQVCYVYLFSGIAKLNDENWLNGTAVMASMQTNHYSLPLVVSHAASFAIIFTFLNYMLMAYQLLFPFTVWIKKVKVSFLIIGVVMHLYIAFIMGLVTFGAIMILAYIYFWPEKTRAE